MGNCPSANAIPGPSSGTCVLKCPAQFRYDVVRGCVSVVDPSVAFMLEPIPWIPWVNGKPSNVESIDQLRTTNPALYGQYSQALVKFNADLAVAQGSIDRSAQVKSSFERLQSTQNVSDQFPDAYQQARLDYYTLIKGPKWAEGEKARIANTDAAVKVNGFSREFQSLQGQINQQQSLIELLNASKDKVLGVTDVVQKSVSTLNKQVDEVKNQINMNTIQHSNLKKKQSWFVFILNILTVLLLVYVILLIVGRFTAPKNTTSFNNGSYGRPYGT